MSKVSQFNLSKVEKGAIQELLDVSVKKVIDNIADPNTDPNKERSLTLKLNFKRQKGTSFVNVSATTSEKLVSDNPIETTLQLRMFGNTVEFEQLNSYGEEAPSGENVINIEDRKDKTK